MASLPSTTNDVSILSHAVLDHVYNITSKKHLDTATCFQEHTEQYLPASKYTISSFNQSELDDLSNVYHKLFPALFEHNPVYLPQTYERMLSITINGQKFKSDQFVCARSVFSFSDREAVPSLMTLRTVFTDPDVRPAKIHYFFVHSIKISSSELSSHPFAFVSWPMRHPLHSSIGKPFEVWCSSLYENCTANCFVPLNYIVSPLLTAQQVFEGENVLVTVPLIS